MDGVHDLGGMHGFGRVEPEADEPPFHEPWEGRVHGMMLALGVGGHLRGNFRHAIERMDPVHYLSSSYYEHWLAACETLLVEGGVVDAAELRRAQGPAQRRDDPAAADFMRSLFRPRPVRDGAGEPRWAPGGRVLVSRRSHDGHSRCPRYVRGAPGTVERVHAPSPLPDGGPPEPSYTVVFDAADLWGADAEPATVSVDLWESYLEPAEAT